MSYPINFFSRPFPLAAHIPEQACLASAWMI